MNNNSENYSRLIVFALFLIAVTFINTNNNLIYAQYEKNVVFKKMPNPYKDFDITKPIMFLYLNDLDDTFDPATCTEKDALEIISGTYEPPLTYHYLKRPYEIVPLTAKAIPKPVYFREVRTGEKETKYIQCTYDELLKAMNSKKDENNTVFPKNEESEIDSNLLTGEVKISYRIQITPGIYYAPHPCFAKDEKGYLYHSGKGNGRTIDEDFGNSISSLEDFPYFSSRELVASDYVYGMRRLFNPRIGSNLLYKFLLKYFKDGNDFFKTLHKAYGESDEDDDWDDDWDEEYYGGYYGDEPQLLPYLDYDFDGVKLIDKYTFEINLKAPQSNFLHYLTMYCFSPIPWEADLMYNEFANTDYKSFSFDIHPVGTGPYTVRYYSRYSSYYWGMDRYKGNYPVTNSENLIISNRNPYFNRLANKNGKTPPIYNKETGFGVDKNNNGKLDNDELPYYDLNNNGKFDGMINGEGYYFEDLNNNGNKDDNELWYVLPTSYRNTYPNDGMANQTNADLTKILEIRRKQKEFLINNNLSEYSKLSEEAISEINRLAEIGVNIEMIGDIANGNLNDSGRRLPIIETIIRNSFNSKPQMLAYLANGYLDSIDPELNENINIVSKFGEKVTLVEDWYKRGIHLEKNIDLTISYWGLNMRNNKIGWNERDSVRASDSLRKIRQAIAIVFNIEDWIEKFSPDSRLSPTFAPQGLYDPDNYLSQIPNLWIYKSDGNNGYKRRSIDEAKNLLKEAGWEDGKNKDGVQLTLQMNKYAFMFGEDEIDWFRSIFSQISIAISTVEDVDPEDYFEGIIQLFYSEWHPLIPDISEYAYMFYGHNSDFSYSRGSGWGKVNKSNYMNMEYDHLYEQLSKTIDENEKNTIISKLNKLINFDLPSLGFLTTKQYATYYPWLQNHKSSNITCRQQVYQRIDPIIRKKMQAEILKLYE